jgi:hypothetical protein
MLGSDHLFCLWKEAVNIFYRGRKKGRKEKFWGRERLEKGRDFIVK